MGEGRRGEVVQVQCMQTRLAYTYLCEGVGRRSKRRLNVDINVIKSL